MTKISEILDVDLTNSTQIFNLQFAYKIRQYLDGKQGNTVHRTQK